MSSVNKVIIIGNLGKDPESRTFPNGDAVCNVSIATTDKWKDKTTGEQQELTEWHRVSFFGRLAEIAGQYLVKGSSCYVEGSIRTRKYTDKDGVEKYSTEIRADRLQLLSSPKGDGGNQNRGQDDRQSNDRDQRGNNNQRQADPARQQPRQEQRQPDRSPGQRSNQQPQQQQRNAAPAKNSNNGGSYGGGFDDMDSDIPF